MARVLAIDYGTKRIGLAITDELKMIATPLETISTNDIFVFLEQNIGKQQIDTLVIGEPKQMNNEASQIAHLILGFERKVRQLYPMIQVERVDERFTSKMAFQTMIDAGIGKKKRQDKSMVDKISACIILQSYLERAM